jgi:hypothetical protein
MQLVRNEEIDRVRRNLEGMLLTTEALSEEWITTNILNTEERKTKHSIFWLLYYDDRSKKLEEWLTILKNLLPDAKFSKIVNSLKEKRGEIDFKSLLPEIEVLAYYGTKKDSGVRVEYEPDIPKKENVGDIKLSIGSNEVYFEITRLFSSEREEKRRPVASTGFQN